MYEWNPQIHCSLDPSNTFSRVDVHFARILSSAPGGTTRSVANAGPVVSTYLCLDRLHENDEC